MTLWSIFGNFWDTRVLGRADFGIHSFICQEWNLICQSKYPNLEKYSFSKSIIFENWFYWKMVNFLDFSTFVDSLKFLMILKRFLSVKLVNLKSIRKWVTSKIGHFKKWATMKIGHFENRSLRKMSHFEIDLSNWSILDLYKRPIFEVTLLRNDPFSKWAKFEAIKFGGVPCFDVLKIYNFNIKILMRFTNFDIFLSNRFLLFFLNWTYFTPRFHVLW